MPQLAELNLPGLLSSALVNLITAGVILLVGRWFAGLVRRWTRAAMQRTHATRSIAEISERGAYYFVLLLVFFAALVALGIPAQLLITIIGIVAIIAAVALRESLRDVAATVIFVVFQPFKAGDLIETNGVVGHVQEILMFNTVLITMDSRKLIIPNGNIQNTNLINYSALDQIRLDLPVRLSYADDLQRARALLLEIANADTRVLRDPPPVVDVMELSDSSISLMLRVHSTPNDFWALRPALNEKVKLEFDARGLTFPFPQLDLHFRPVQGESTQTNA